MCLVVVAVCTNCYKPPHIQTQFPCPDTGTPECPGFSPHWTARNGICTTCRDKRIRWQYRLKRQNDMIEEQRQRPAKRARREAEVLAEKARRERNVAKMEEEQERYEAVKRRRGEEERKLKEVSRKKKVAVESSSEPKTLVGTPNVEKEIPNSGAGSVTDSLFENPPSDTSRKISDGGPVTVQCSDSNTAKGLAADSAESLADMAIGRFDDIDWSEFLENADFLEN